MSSGASVASPPARRSRADGRPPLLEKIPPKIRAELMERIRKGVPFNRAAQSCGVNPRTFDRWMEFGRREDAKEPYRAFAAQVERAFADFVVAKVEQMDAAGTDDWRAALEMMKRRDPQNFKDPDRATGGELNVTVTVAAERSAAAEEMLAAALRALEGDPERLEVFLGELGGGRVVDGDAVEVAEIEAA